MPIFFQHQINDTTRLGIWKIEESEEFFKGNVPQHRDVTHPHKRLQHLAGRFLLQFLFPDFPYALIRIADTRKPFLPDEQFHFSISHCGDFAAAIVSKDRRVGIDVEMPSSKIERIKEKFLNEEEFKIFSIGVLSDNIPRLTIGQEQSMPSAQLLTSLWSAKESVFKWYGDGGVDFKENILLKKQHESNETIDCFFTKNQQQLSIHYRLFDHLVLAWVMS
jgi:phosphopantetheinyl transferase